MFIFVRFGNISADTEHVVHIHLVQQAGMLVGMLVVAFVAFEEASWASLAVGDMA